MITGLFCIIVNNMNYEKLDFDSVCAKVISFSIRDLIRDPKNFYFHFNEEWNYRIITSENFLNWITNDKSSPYGSNIFVAKGPEKTFSSKDLYQAFKKPNKCFCKKRKLLSISILASSTSGEDLWFLLSIFERKINWHCKTDFNFEKLPAYMIYINYSYESRDIIYYKVWEDKSQSWIKPINF